MNKRGYNIVKGESIHVIPPGPPLTKGGWGDFLINKKFIQ